MNVSGVIDSIIKPNRAPGDYTGSDGLLHCGKCHEPKEIYGEGQLAGKLLPVTCACKRREKEKRAEEERCSAIEEMRSRCLPSEAMRQHTFSVASNEKHICIAQKYVAAWDKMLSESIGLLLWGNTGTGKSFTAHCIANALIDQGIRARLYAAEDVVSRLTDKERRGETLQVLRDAPLLIVDDLGAEPETAYSRSKLCAALDARIESGKPLIVTTNYSLQEMENATDHIQQRIFDRIKAHCVPIRVVGESRRVAIGQKKLMLAKAILEGEP